MKINHSQAAALTLAFTVPTHLASAAGAWNNVTFQRISSKLGNKLQAHNLAGLSETDSHAFNPHARRAMHLISWLFHRAEVVNREATALAAYRLARRSGMEHAAAVSYGHEAVMESHFDYSNANRVRWMQSNAAKVLLLYI